MPTRLFSTLTKRVAPHAPGCPNPVVEAALQDAAVEVCEKTLAWRYEQAQITLTTGVYDYPYEPPTDTEVHAILTARVNDVTVKPLTLEQVQERYPFWPSSDTAHQGTPLFLVHIDVDTFYIAPAPNSSPTYLMDMVVALKPLRTATGMDKTTLDDLEDAVIHGTLQRLLVMPNSTWTELELAAYHAKQYIYKVAERRARTNLGSGRASLAIKQQPWA
jgi:hypothetical protein